MTDFESEKLYHDLRRKLEGYGSAPPETVWAGIQEQLPKRKRRRPVLLLLFLGTVLVGLTVGTGQLRPFFSTEPTARPGGRFVAATTERRAATGISEPGVASPALASTPATAAAARGTTTAVPAATASAAAHASLTAPVERARKAAGRYGTSRLLLAGAPASTKRSLDRATGGAAETEAEAETEAGYSTATTAANRRGRRKTSWATGMLASGTSSRTRMPRLGASRRSSETLGRISRPSRSYSATGTSSTLGNGSRRAGHGRAVSSHASGTKATGFLDGESGTAEASALNGKRARQPNISNAPLELRMLITAAPEPEEPEVRTTRRRPNKRPSRRELRLRNWSGQLLLGSALTYRALGGSPTQLEKLERPSLGFSGQATATYALSRQLAVSAGLGYTEYATALRYQLQKTSQESAINKDFRDVYRFLTVPMQAQLTLRGGPRWRYGVLGGGTLAFLAGAQTTEGSACNCKQVQWPSVPEEMPFTRTNLLLTGGAFASYQFALGQWLTIRPQGQIFLNSLATPASGRAARRPWGLGVQAGYSWDLDPRKH
ncbi:hypothetical protein [Hymenobacter lucidus]|uniref:PorT family protein n=1 Tax=Hymenobacter lucidus TaxID=2880930 RepID=A0ABS8AQM1_9BACT|nr:hypothetical protein [Hymenobacter lucidus]MCB2407898.1 hypothetical protein [Hymenobacter lucidus]